MSAAHDHDYEALDARLTVVEAQMSGQAVLAKSVRDLAIAVDALGRIVEGLRLWSRQLDARLDIVEERLDRIEDKVDRLDTKVDNLDGKFDIMLAILQGDPDTPE